jgi:hypothetical protein
MDDLRPLVDDPDGSPLARALLASARSDAPPPHARARAARRLGIAAVLAVGAGAGSEAGALVVAGKLVAVLLALGGVVGLAMWQSPAMAPDRGAAHNPADDPPAGTERTAHAPPAVIPSSTAPVDPPRVASTVATPPARPPVATPVAAPPARTRTPARPAQRPTPRPTSTQDVSQAAPVADAPPTDTLTPALPAEPVAATAVPDVAVPDVTAPPPAEVADIAAVSGPSRLAAEVALVDRARARLGAGDYPAALAALDEYHRRFPSGDLDAEADMVMIEILIAQREVERARTLGRAFLARFPRSPLAQRVHSLLDRLPK